MQINGITYFPHKSNKVRSIILTIIILILLILVSIIIISVVAGWNLVHPDRAVLPAFTSNIVPEYKDVSFTDSNNELRLKGWFFQSKGSTRTVIFAHGYERNRLQFGEKTIDMVKALLSKNYNVLLFDFRNSGLSEGDVTSISINEKYDLHGAVRYVKAQGSTRIALLGFSMGAAASILTAAEGADVDAVIADSSFSDLKEYLDKSLPQWSHLPSIPFNKTIFLSVRIFNRLDPSDSSPRDAITKIAPRPVLLIHSKNDKTIPSSNSRELYNICSNISGSKVEFWESDGAAHVGTFEKNPEEYMARVISFLDKALEIKKQK